VKRKENIRVENCNCKGRDQGGHDGYCDARVAEQPVFDPIRLLLPLIRDSQFRQCSLCFVLFRYRESVQAVLSHDGPSSVRKVQQCILGQNLGVCRLRVYLAELTIRSEDAVEDFLRQLHRFRPDGRRQELYLKPRGRWPEKVLHPRSPAHEVDVDLGQRVPPRLDDGFFQVVS